MLSVCTLKSASSASKYYESGDYYIGGEVAQNEWFGRGALELGLVGNLAFADFKNILSGLLPDGTQLPEGKTGRRPGYDLTFSAPKSVSILALVAGDEQLFKAHTAAVTETLAYIESAVLKTRVKKNGVISQHKTNNMVASLHTHTDSRELDPNLHTHCVIANLTKDVDKWRAIYGDDFYDLKMDLGFRYRNILAQKALQLGYEVIVTSDKGTFELKAVATELIKLYSKRREQIEEKLTEVAVTENNRAAFSSMANFLTRKEKQSITMSDAKLYWESGLATSSYTLADLQQIVLAAKEHGAVMPKDKLSLAQDVIKEAIVLEGNRNAVFSIDSTIATARRLSVGEEMPQDFFLTALSAQVKNKEIINMGDNWFTTPKARLEENNILQKTAANNKTFKLAYLFPKLLARLYFKDKQNQDIAVKILATQDRFIILNYEKTEDLNQVMPKLDALLKSTGYTHHLHLTKKQAENFQTATGIKGKNLFGTLEYMRQVKPSNATNIWIIHHSHKIDSHLQNIIIEQATKMDAKVIYLNAPNRNSGLAKGRPMGYLIRENICASFTLGQEPALTQDIVEQQFNTLQFSEITCQKQRRQESINWLLQQDLTSSAIYVASNMEKDLLNSCVKEQLLAQDKLGASIIIPKLQEVYLIGRQKAYAGNYAVGDLIYFTRGEKKNSYWKITEIDELRHRFKLSNQDEEEQLSLKAKTSLDNFKLYRETRVAIHSNDILVWKQKTQDLSKGERVRVKSVQATNYVIETEAGKQITIEPNLSNAHFDYGYAQTINQDDWTKTGAVVLAAIEYCPWVKFNAGKQTVVFTDNKEKLKESMLRNLGFKPHAYNATPVEFIPETSKSTLQELSQYLATKQEHTSLQELQVGGELYRACQRFEFALQAISEKDAVFFEHELIKKAQDVRISEQALTKAFNLYSAAGIIQTLGNYLTTREIINMEQACVSLMQKHKNSVTAILESTHPALFEIRQNSFLMPGQKDAIIDSLTTTDRFTAIHGSPGVGKTALLKELKRYGREAGFDYIGITNTAAARNNLSDKTADYQNQQLTNVGIEAKTLASFLFYAQKDLPGLKEEFNRKIILVDEASMVGLRDLHSLMHIAEKLDSRITFLGDVKQLPAIEASKGYHMLLATGMEFSLVSTNVRLKSHLALTALKELYAEQITKAFTTLAGNILEVKDNHERLKTMAYIYVAQPNLNDVMPMFSLNKDLQEFNALVREQLKSQGVLTGLEIETKILVAKDVPDIAKNNPFSYAKSDMVLFHSNIASLGITKGNYYQVLDSAESSITLQVNHQAIKLQLSQHQLSQGRVEIFTQETRHLMAGDTIRWRKNNETEGIVNSHEAKVIAVKDGQMLVHMHGQAKAIDLNEHKFTHFDHAYGATVHTVQGLDKPMPMGHSQTLTIKQNGIESYHPINNLNSFLVMASRGDDFLFFVDDKQQYMQALQQNCNVKLSALEISMGDDWNKLNNAFKDKIKTIDGLIDRQAIPEVIQVKQELCQEFALIKPEKKTERYSTENIKQRLNQDVIAFVSRHLGRPILCNSKQAMWALGNDKKKPNLGVEISGSKAGFWCDYRTQEGGKDLISFYMKFTNTDYKTALKELSIQYGIKKELTTIIPKIDNSKFESKERVEKIKQANKTYQSGLPIAGTLAEKYLREERGIQGELPAEFRFHPGLYHYLEEKNFPALLIPAKDKQGNIIALNRIFLNQDGSKILGSAKLAQGIAKGATIDINHGSNIGKTYISEGLENALTIFDAKPNYDIKACLSIGNLGGISFRPGTHTVVIVADNDLNNHNTKQALINAVDSFKSQGLNVELALPKSLDKKLDLNDVYKSSGLQGVLKILNSSISIENSKQLGDKQESLQDSFNRIERESLRLMSKSLPCSGRGIA